MQRMHSEMRRNYAQITNSDVTVGRPDKLRVDFKGRKQPVQLYYDAGHAVLYAPGPKLYAVIPTRAKTLDGVLQELEKRDVYLPAKNLLASDPYQTLLPDIKTGYVIGQVEMFGKQVHQLAFTEKDAEYQLWVTGAPAPRPRASKGLKWSIWPSDMSPVR